MLERNAEARISIPVAVEFFRMSRSRVCRLVADGLLDGEVGGSGRPGLIVMNLRFWDRVERARRAVGLPPLRQPPVLPSPPSPPKPVKPLKPAAMKKREKAYSAQEDRAWLGSFNRAREKKAADKAREAAKKGRRENC